MSFSASDQKRLVRGELLLQARSRLRIRDRVHHAKWRVLILAGPTPSGEIKAIREVMPHAEVVAIDRDPESIQAARAAGADLAVECDLSAFSAPEQRGYGMARLLPAQAVTQLGPFDVISLDLCAGPSAETRDLVRVYAKAGLSGPDLRRHGPLTKGGILIATFSYGRDVVEYFRQQAQGIRLPDLSPGYLRAGSPLYAQTDAWNALQAKLRPEMLGRLLYVFGLPLLPHLRTVMMYRGNEMPMCSVLMDRAYRVTPEVIFVGPGDYELAVAHPDPENLYDTPAERIYALRRSHAAIKAAYTKRTPLDVADVGGRQ